MTTVCNIHQFRSRAKLSFDLPVASALIVIFSLLFIICYGRGQENLAWWLFGGPMATVLLSLMTTKVISSWDRTLKTKFDSKNIFYERHNGKYSPRAVIENDCLQHVNGRWIGSEKYQFRFRGINLPAKTPSYPTNLQNTKSQDNFFESKTFVSFVGRPFPLQDAPMHFQRLSNFGYNLVRLTVTWEAVMHEGPGIIDQAYLQYLNNLVDIAFDFGIYVLIDPHQDVWSRFTGGDGAPSWTIDMVGFKVDKALHHTGCAVLHQLLDSEETPRMLWPTNYFKLVTATMFTLFFAGDEFAKGQKVPGTDETFQHFLQRQYLIYLDAVAASLNEKKNIIGFGTMNEANAGFVGIQDLNIPNSPAPYGNMLSAFESMRLGSGESIDSDYYPAPFFYHRTDKLNSTNISVWKDPELDVWKKAGVYDIDEAGKRILLRPQHFKLKDKDFMSEFMEPFFISVHETITKHNKTFVTVAEPHLDITNPFVRMPDDLDNDNFSWAPHFYDFLMLVTKIFWRFVAIDIDRELLVFTPYFIDRVFRRNLRRIKESGGGKYVLIGELGIPFDMQPRTNYNVAMNRILKAMEANDLDYTLWCYYAANTDQEGDEWNGENLSIITKDGCRCISTVVRPFAFKYSTTISKISQHFDPFKQKYELNVDAGTGVDDCSARDLATLQIFVPACHFSTPKISTSSGSFTLCPRTQALHWSFIPKDCTERLEIVECDE